MHDSSNVGIIRFHSCWENDMAQRRQRNTGSEEPRRRGSRKEKSGSGPMIMVIGLLIAVGGGAFYYMNNKNQSDVPPRPEGVRSETAPKPEPAPQETAPAAEPKPAPVPAESKPVPRPTPPSSTSSNTGGMKKGDPFTGKKGRTLFVSYPEHNDDIWGSDDKLVWIEGEDAVSQDMIKHNWYNSVKKGELSGNDWISNFGNKAGTAEYKVTIPKTASYTLWMRANPTGTKLSWQLDDGQMTQVNMRKDVGTRVNIASNNAIDLRYVAWIKVAKMDISEGEHTFKIRMDSGNNNHGGLDCFVFTPGVFTPQGKNKPGEKLGLADPGTWAFEPEPDKFTDEAMFDLRDMNENIAGESGWVRLSDDGEGFVLGNGKPVRFWAINTGVSGRKSMDDMKRHARTHAKRGVNMSRYFQNVPAAHEGSKITDINRTKLDELHLHVAGMKRYGIYTLFTPYWGGFAKMIKSWGLEGNPSSTSALLFFNKKMQDAYKAWMKTILTEVNPYTGIPLGQDPALAIIQLQNEDSLLFWTINRLEKEKAQYEMLGKQFGDWLKKKYGSIEAAQQAWSGDSHKLDKPGEGIFGFHNLWEMTQNRSGGRAKRLDDQLQFWTETMYNFNKMMTAYIKDELGYKGLINAGNWKSGDTVKLEDCERYSYTSTDIVAVNRYIGTPHKGVNNKQGYLIENGDHFIKDWSALKQGAWSIPVSLKLVKGYPFLITESCWVPPTRYQSEGPFLISAYSSLSGFDTYYWFSYGDVAFSSRIGKWDSAHPMALGQFPAAALMFRAGYIQESKPVVHEERDLSAMWKREIPMIAETKSFDPNRDIGDGGGKSPFKKGVNPLAFLAGRVEVVYGGDPSKNKVSPELDTLIDESAKKVTSATGELEFDYGRGICILDAPKAKGVSGFLKAGGGKFSLSDCFITSSNEYATVIAAAMDDYPLTESGKILVQVGTVCRPHGWKTSPARFEVDKKQVQGVKILSIGGAPWNVVNTQCSISFSNRTLKKAVVLDPNGYPLREIPLQSTGAGVSVTLPADSLYVMITK